MATKEKIGTVVSNKMDKTIIIIVEEKYAHPLYGKTVKKTRRFMAHDEKNQCLLGDKVIISETRPLSRKKRWALEQILTKTKISN
jgi:small subunit ribosomal protein S17|tara:strand:- start:12735 stop:12989 length:255 start_codon:yes stop_codon:yes gene_type:complete